MSVIRSQLTIDKTEVVAENGIVTLAIGGGRLINFLPGQMVKSILLRDRRAGGHKDCRLAVIENLYDRIAQNTELVYFYFNYIARF